MLYIYIYYMYSIYNYLHICVQFPCIERPVGVFRSALTAVVKNGHCDASTSTAGVGHTGARSSLNVVLQ